MHRLVHEPTREGRTAGRFVTSLPSFFSVMELGSDMAGMLGRADSLRGPKLDQRLGKSVHVASAEQLSQGHKSSKCGNTRGPVGR